MALDLFTHTHESTKANAAIYNEQKQRLSVNAWIILFCLLDGQYLSAIDFVSGISFTGMNNVRFLCEYRRRICELKDKGVEVVFTMGGGGVKIHHILDNKREEYRIKYEPYKAELLAKINK